MSGHDPLASGMERLQHLADQRRATPGMWKTLGMRLVAVEPGSARVEVVLGDRHANGSGMAHGGLVAAVIDSACGAAMATYLSADKRIATVDLAVSYHRPVPLVGTLVAVGQVLHSGRMLGNVECEVTGPSGKVVATGRAVFAVLDRDDLHRDPVSE